MLCCERAWLDSESADTVRINLMTKDVKENVVVRDAKERTTLSAARECVRCKRTKSVDWRRKERWSRRQKERVLVLGGGP